MLYLVAASLLWAFSFGLIKTQLAGLDPLLVAFIRLAISALLFAPWLARRLPRAAAARAAAIGAVQFGLMYALYIASYAWLPAYMVALLTIVTPLYVVAIVDVRRRRFDHRHVGGALLAVAGAGMVVARAVDTSVAWPGIVLLQGANLCFAAGQIAYRDLVRGVRAGAGAGRGAGSGLPETTIVAWMYLGATALTGLAALVWGRPDVRAVGRDAWLVLLYLGAVPTGLGFLLWNRGAARARAGVLAVCNNLKVPLGVLTAWLVFGESASYLRVLVGLAVILAAVGLTGTEAAGTRDADGTSGSRR